MSWSEVETTGIPPSPCYGHSANYIGDNKIIYFGGKGFSVLNSVHIFDTGFHFSFDYFISVTFTNWIEKKCWKYMTYSGNILVPRWNHVAVFNEVERKLIIHGGKDDQDRYLCSVIEINVGMSYSFPPLFSFELTRLRHWFIWDWYWGNFHYGLKKRDWRRKKSTWNYFWFAKSSRRVEVVFFL